jgi:hypothetical protein
MSVQVAELQYTALVEIPIVSVSRDETEIKIVGGKPYVVDDVIRASGADTTDFINMAVESSKRRRNITGPALVAGGIDEWSGRHSRDAS